MDVSKKMHLFQSKSLSILFALLLSSTLAVEAFATTTKVEIVDGKIVSKDIKPSRTNLRIICANAKYTLWAQSFGNKSPVFYVKVRFGAEKNVTTVHIGEEVSSKLKSSHLIENAEYGCLNDMGGLGIHIPSITDEHADLFLQISGEGRVFEKFDQTGYTITKRD